MLIISKTQLNKLAQTQQEAFAQKALLFLKQKYPCGFLSVGVRKEEEKKVVYDAIIAAKSYGIRFENDVLLYIECMLQLGVNFDKNSNTSWAGKILQDLGLSGESKMNAIYEHIVFFRR